MAHHPVLELFSPAVRAWFAASFPAPTPPQVDGWPAINSGAHTLVCAPTGSGKTLTAFLASIDRLVTSELPDPKTATRVLYISPLRALAFDVEKNLRSPLLGVQLAAERLGIGLRAPTVAMRTGDTSARDRQALIRRPPDLLITTPESLYLMLTSSAASTLVNVDTVIIDEIHAMATTKRGAHLMLSLERLEQITATAPQRIGLSATQRPLTEVAHFLGGHFSSGERRPVEIVDAGIRKQLELQVVVPVEDMGEIGQPVQRTDVNAAGSSTGGFSAPQRTSIWSSIVPDVLQRILAHRSTIVFSNGRRQTERLANQLNELAAEMGIESPTGELVRAHHGSLAREQRIIIEDQLKRGELRGIVATSSLELGIDMGAVDLVIQVESPGSVARGLQRIGRAGHSVGEPSRGTLFPKHRGDLLETAVVAARMLTGEIEATRFLRNPLDVLAQQIVAHVAAHPDTSVGELATMVRRCASFHDLSDDLLHNVLDLLSGRYPSDEFSELRPRLVWDRVNDTLRPRDGARRLAVTSGGTIPDRGLFGVFLSDGTRVGELDEEMVYESRPGETFVLGASTWRIEDITFQKVLVSPAPGEPGKMPFWHGDRPGRPLELGRALGAFVREVRAMPVERAVADLVDRHSLDPFAASNVVQYIHDQVDAAGVTPDDRTVVVERFRDEIGDWRVCILSPFGVSVHAPWAMAIERRLTERYDLPVEMLYTDDGIVLRLPDAAEALAVDDLVIDPDDLDELVVAALPSTALFSARFRECSARALLLPRRRPDQRTPLWQQRQRASDLLTVASKHPTFPMLLETSRECLQDVFDLPGLRDVMTQLRNRAIRVVSVDTDKASPFAQSLLFNWIAAYMYEGDAPLAERRAAALALDRDLLRDLLGAEELRELLDPEVVADVELELQCLTDSRRARSVDELHDVLRKVGDLSLLDAELRSTGAEEGTGPGDDVGRPGDTAEWLDTLVRERRAVHLGVGGEQRYIAAEDAGRYRDALGCNLPLGLPQAFTESQPQPLESLVARYARTHAPFLDTEVAARFGTTVERVSGALQALAADGRLLRGEFRPAGSGHEWCDAEVLRQLRRRSLARLRREVEAVDADAYARFLQAWHEIPGERRGLDALLDALGQLQGAALVASTLETQLLPARLDAFRPTELDELATGGELLWVGAGSVGAADGRIRLFLADQYELLHAAWEPQPAPTGPVHEAIRALLTTRGASFWAQIDAATPGATEAETLAALWDLVWAGEVTNDSLAALRTHTSAAPARKAAAGRGRSRRGRLTRLGPPAGSGRWSLVEASRHTAPSATQAAHAVALQLLERYGVVTREAVLAEGVVGGYAGVYQVLKVLEERGHVRRGYFVAGLGAAQFAVPGAVDRLRAARQPADGELHPELVPAAVVLAATDPAQPYGSVIGWPDTTGRPARLGSAWVVLRQGVPLAWIDRRSHSLVTFSAAAADSSWAGALAKLVTDGRVRSVEVRKINGEPLTPQSAEVAALAASGFIESYRGWVRRK